MKKIIPRVGHKFTSLSKPTGITENYWQPLLAEGKPISVMSIDGAGVVLAALRAADDIGRTDLVTAHFRITGIVNGRFVDVPDYALPPAVAALNDFNYHVTRWKRAFPNDWEFIRRNCWFQVNNEPDQTKTEWLAMYGMELIRLGKLEGIKTALFGWSTGTPDYSAWDGPEMARLLNMLRNNRADTALALHEYSLSINDLEFLSDKTLNNPDTKRAALILDKVAFGRSEEGDMAEVINNIELFVGQLHIKEMPVIKYSATESLESSHLIGRWRNCPQLRGMNIIFPEFGWAERAMPNIAEAMIQLDNVWARYYGYPEVLGHALWVMDGSWGDLQNKLIEMMPALTQWTKTEYVEVSDDPDEPLPVKHKAIVVKAPQGLNYIDWMAVAKYAYENRHTLTQSHDDMMTILEGGNRDSYVKLVGGRSSQPDVADLIESNGYTWVPLPVYSVDR